jgi:hypothetical protein
MVRPTKRKREDNRASEKLEEQRTILLATLTEYHEFGGQKAMKMHV